MTRIVAVIQARMGSTRLPGKSLIDIAGRPLIWHVVHRLRASRHIGLIVLATTTERRDDALVRWAGANGVMCVRGPEDDVLGRFALAAEATDPDVIVRVNADAPLIDAAFIDAMLDAMLAEDADFVVLAPGEIAAHDGVDPMSRRALDLMLAEARDDPVAREHVTAWLKLNPARIRTALMKPDPAYAMEGLRLSVDTPDDLAFVEAVHTRLKARAGEASLTGLIALARRDPSLLAINGHVRQKAPTAESGMVLIRCDGGAALGLGHVKRCLSLARSLRDVQGLGVAFATIGDDGAAAMIAAAGFPVLRKPEALNERDWLAQSLTETGARALVLDIRTDLGEADVRALREQAGVVVALDDASPRRLGATLAVYPPVPQTRRLGWPTGEVDLCIGWGWAILGDEPWRQPRHYDANRTPVRVLVSMGGSDPQGLTQRAVRAISYAGQSVQPVVAIGPACEFPEALADACKSAAPNAEIVFAPPSILPVAATCDLALLAFGVTAYECAHVGTPAIYIGLTGDHAESAQGFERAGFGVNLGVTSAQDERRMLEATRELIADPDRRRAMSAAGRLGVDGRGAERLAYEIALRLFESGDFKSARTG